ncbi:MAG TPA: glycosyltransferase [Candidatus Polarisedimenticolaceae bacterium]|nr:glycosyltransferase [Candidatus Polarisedimenticolaceae bacterium]
MSRFHAGRIAIVYPNDGTDIRIGKTCRSLSAAGFDVHFVGWDRRPGPPRAIELGGAERHVMTLGTAEARGDASGTLRFAGHVQRTLRRLRPEFASAVNEEYALLVLPLRRIAYRHLVCDIFDSLADRRSAAAVLSRWAARLICAAGRSGADRLIVTDEARLARLGRHRVKATVVANYPEDPGDELALVRPAGPTKVYVSGTLSAARGLREILEALESIDDARIVAAGWPYDDYARRIFLTHDKVRYCGAISAASSLARAAECDAVFAFYAPDSLNNRMASPNKVYDAMGVGRPVIINREVALSRWVEQHELGFVCPYHDRAALGRVLAALGERRGRIASFAERARRLFKQGYSWARMEARLLELYGGLTQDRSIGTRS